MNWSTLSPELRELAERVCTDKELAALKLWDPGRVGYGSIALALDIAPETARGRVQRALRKIEKETRGSEGA